MRATVLGGKAVKEERIMLGLRKSCDLTFVQFTFVILLALSHAFSFGAQNSGASPSARVDRLALEVERANAVRAVKELQHSYAQYAQFGLWSEMALLFAERAEFINGEESIRGRAAIRDHFLTKLGHGKHGLPAGELRARIVATERLLPAPVAPRARNSSILPADMDARIKEAERKLAISKAYDGTENVSSAYGDYLDDLDFGELAKIFALKGAKEIPFAGFYVGRGSIARRETPSGKRGPRARTSLTLHLRTQPVILVARDGRSSSIRTRLFQPASSRTQALGFSGGMYHDQAVLENGSWKLWSVAIDEHYFSSPNYQGGWSAAKDPPPGAPRLTMVGTSAGYPPDIPLTVLGERQRGFLGATGDPIVWPSILPMWFHYRNPVSGHVPEHFWPDCVTCTYAPYTSMKNHGYLLPPW